MIASQTNRVVVSTVESLEPRRLFAGTPAGNVFTQTNLVSDGFVTAAHTDTDLKNPWGMASSPVGPFWVSDNGTSKTTLYDGAGNKNSLIVSIPGCGGMASAPTGQVFNPTSAFKVTKGNATGPATFIFVGEDGGITGWNAEVDATNAVMAVDNSAVNASYKGVTMGTVKHLPRLYATNFASGRIEMYDGSFKRIGSKIAFKDNLIAAGYVPFNVQNLNGLIYVTYALRGSNGDDVGGRGHGYVDVYSTSGVLLRRFRHGTFMNSPWGLAVAPSSFGPFAGDIIVGMFGSGRMAVMNPGTGKFMGFLDKADGFPIQNDGLWAIRTGNGGSGGDTDKLYFTAGPNDEADGLFGSVQISA